MKRHLRIAAAIWNSLQFISVAYAAYNALRIPEPYMDEIFHVPQTQRYCRGEMGYWDDKITTFPGFHLLSAFLTRLIDVVVGAVVGGEYRYCSLYTIRSCNLIWLFVNFNLLKKLKAKVDDCSEESGDVTLWSLTASLIPVYYFYGMLFYTDLMSISFLMLSHLCFMDKRPHSAALFGAMSISVRQTNVVWFAFFLFDSVLGRSLYPTGRLVQELQSLIWYCWGNKRRLLAEYWSSLSILVLFLMFVRINGGIVVGDKAAHKPALHGAQLPYLFLFLLGCLFPTFLYQPRVIYLVAGTRISIKEATFLGLSFTLFALLLFKGRIAHPYLISDNRHLSFYVWRRFLSKDAVAAFLIPFSWFSWLMTWRLLTDRKGYLWTLSWMVCSVTTLIPSGLLEFRYFLPPALIASIYFPRIPQRALLLQALIYSVANAVLIHLFFHKTFVWDDGSIARFIL